MPVNTEPLEETDDSAVYTWTIRVLYAAALGMNVWLLWKASQDDTDLAILRTRIANWGRRVTLPLHHRAEWKKALGRMHWEAREIVEEGASDG